MDEPTLASLRAAYTRAPSPDLAGVLALALAGDGRTEEARPFLDALERPLADETAARLADALLEHGRSALVRPLLDPARPAQAIDLARCTLAEGEESAARLEYLDVLERAPSLATDALNDLFGVRPSGAATEGAPTLRVAERGCGLDLSDFVAAPETPTSFDDVVGLEPIKRQIERRIILPFRRPSLYHRFRKKVGGGVLLYGPPGCGKTLIARATAGQCGASFQSVQVSDVLDMHFGESERRLHALFDRARAATPAVLFFDELEALAGRREHGRNSLSANLVSQFLSELDGFARENEGVLVLAATNTPWAIDAAFLRPGRFDRLFFVPPPDRAAREAVLRLALRGRPVEGDPRLEAIAAKTPGFSGADLAELVESAADEAIDESLSSGEDVAIGQRHLLSALDGARSTTGEWLTTARNYARYANDGGRYDEVLAFVRTAGR